MPVTLAQAQLNTQVDLNYAVIDNLRRFSWVWDQIVFDDTVSPGTTGATLTYAYTRLLTPRSSQFRAYNTEYIPEEAKTEQVSVNLKPNGGAFGVDRILAKLGPAGTNSVAINMQQLNVAVTQRWLEELINGDVAVNPLGFDGLNKALTGATTEYDPLDNGVTVGYLDATISTVNSQPLAMAILDHIDMWLSSITPSHIGGGDSGEDGALPGGVKAILGNTRAIARLKSIARWAGLYTETKDSLGRQIESYGPWVLHDMGDGQLGTSPIIHAYSADADEGGGGSTITGLTDLYAVCFGLDALHAASAQNAPVVQAWLPDFTTSGAVKSGEMELGPTAMVLKNVKACGVLRKVKV